MWISLAPLIASVDKVGKFNDGGVSIASLSFLTSTSSFLPLPERLVLGFYVFSTVCIWRLES
jgi:hypothetical protein